MCRALCSLSKPCICRVHAVYIVHNMCAFSKHNILVMSKRSRGNHFVFQLFPRERETPLRVTQKSIHDAVKEMEKKYKCFGSRDHVCWETDCQVYYIYIYRYNCSVREWRVLQEWQYKTTGPWDETFLSFIIFFICSEDTVQNIVLIDKM